MKGTSDETVMERFQPTEEDDWSVVIVVYDTMKAPYDDDYIRAPYRFDSLEDVSPLPEKEAYERVVITQDGDHYPMPDLRADPPDWFEIEEDEDEG